MPAPSQAPSSVGPSAPAQRGANLLLSPKRKAKVEVEWFFEEGQLHLRIGKVVIL